MVSLKPMVDMLDGSGDVKEKRKYCEKRNQYDSAGGGDASPSLTGI